MSLPSLKILLVAKSSLYAVDQLGKIVNEWVIGQK